jgi:hypothetical protein
MSEGDDWPPPAAQTRAALWRAEGHFERREYFAASAALAPVFGFAGEDEELVRGLHHLAAAGYRHQTGEDERARRQLEHARRRLEAYPDVMQLVRLVEQDVES